MSNKAYMHMTDAKDCLSVAFRALNRIERDDAVNEDMYVEIVTIAGKIFDLRTKVMMCMLEQERVE